MADGDYERLGPRTAELARLKRIIAASRERAEVAPVRPFNVPKHTEEEDNG